MDAVLERFERAGWSRARIVLVAVALAAVMIAGISHVGEGPPQRQTLSVHAKAADGQAGVAADREPPAGMLVDVAGAVRRPGVYELPSGARVLDALRAAGGARTGADMAAVNRAAEVVDGQQILVPVRAEGIAGATAGGMGTAVTGGARVSLNGAPAADLDGLPGIGPVTAQKIVDDRTANGPFRSVEDLDRVPGIGAATIERLRDQVGP